MLTLAQECTRIIVKDKRRKAYAKVSHAQILIAQAMAIDGLSNRVIGEVLSVPDSTIQKYTAAARKTGVAAWPE